jgi:hypothetical protein
MAVKIKAIATLRPRVRLGKKARLKEVVKMIVSRSTLNEGEVYNALRELRDVVAHICLTGRSVSLEGLCSYTPSIQLDGSFKLTHRMDSDMDVLMNTPKAFTGDVNNRDNIGLTPDDLVALWNEENPSDPVTP